MILPIILLQKPSATSKAKNHSDALLRRIDWFNNGNIERLAAECRDIQYRLRPRKRQEDISRFSFLSAYKNTIDKRENKFTYCRLQGFW